MDWRDEMLRDMEEYLDPNGDLLPPWAQFPTYTRYTIGWRMGTGEDYMLRWRLFLEPKTRQERLALLQRQPKAPCSWADHVWDLLEGTHPHGSDVVPARDALLSQGLVASDIAYPTWLAAQNGISVPWPNSEPEKVARYRCRELNFQSRQWVDQTATLDPPPAWRLSRTDPARGLLLLAEQLLQGRVKPPWELGLTVKDCFHDTFEIARMGFGDAFDLWLSETFDDQPHLQRYLSSTDPIPPEWQTWLQTHNPCP